MAMTRNIPIQQALEDPFKVRWARFKHRGEMYQCLTINVLPVAVDRIVPEAGDQYAFEKIHYDRQIEVYVSPTGRSVRVFVDGIEARR
jgi:hypothetical protein